MRIIALLFVAFTFSATAQTASDFTVTDIDGNSRNLFSELDGDNIVVLKFFTNWCSICNNTASDVVAIYNDHQTAGDPVVLWALDRDQNETNADATTYRNNHSIPFPVIGEAYTVAQQFGVLYQPEYYIIRPDRSYVIENSYGAMEAALQEALTTISTGVNELSAGDDYLIGNNTISWNSTNNHRTILKIFDLSGRTVSDYNLLGGETAELNLPNGVYIFSILVEGRTVVSGKITVVSLF
jgi:peroxiredoxin